MKCYISVLCLLVFLGLGCSKDDKDDSGNNNGNNNRLGPFLIYSEVDCRGDVQGLAADYTYGEAGKKIVFSADMKPSALWLPEFYLKEVSSGQYIVYAIEKHANDSTFWVWYDPEEINGNCSFSISGCGAVRLEAFKDVKDVSGSKYVFTFNPNTAGGTPIQTPKGRFLYMGEGRERSTGNCNRGAGVFTSVSAPCRELYEGEKIFDWCFMNLWYFHK